MAFGVRLFACRRVCIYWVLLWMNEFVNTDYMSMSATKTTNTETTDKHNKPWIGLNLTHFETHLSIVCHLIHISVISLNAWDEWIDGHLVWIHDQMVWIASTESLNPWITATQTHKWIIFWSQLDSLIWLHRLNHRRSASRDWVVITAIIVWLIARYLT